MSSLPEPVNPSGGAASAPTTSPAGEGSRTRVRHRVLVVEDSVESQLVVAAQLERLGYDFEIVDTGVAALRAFERSRFSAALVDWHLPGMDGLDVIRRLRILERLHGRHRTPVVSLTARSTPLDIEACLMAGADEHLAKPAGLTELARVLQRWTEETEARPDADNGPTQPVNGSNQIVDEAALGRLLVDIGDVNAFRSVVRSYLDQLPIRLAALTAALGQDTSAVAGAAHSLKGTSALLGASRLAEKMAAMESKARRGHANRPDAGAEIAELAGLTAAAMEQFLDALGAEE